MAYETRDNSGSLFNNNRKESDKHPDRTGSAMIDGVEYWVSGWVKQDRNGKPWLSMAFKRKQEAGSAGVDNETAPAARRGSMKDQLNDEIPFAPEWR